MPVVTEKTGPDRETSNEGLHPDVYYENNFLYWLFTVWARGDNVSLTPGNPFPIFFESKEETPPYLMKDASVESLVNLFEYFNNPSSVMCQYYNISSGPCQNCNGTEIYTSYAKCMDTTSDSPTENPLNSEALINANSSAVTDAGFKLFYPIYVTIFIIIFTIIVSLINTIGNGMVLLSFYLERQLQQATNYFIGSLATTGFLIGIFRYIFNCIAIPVAIPDFWVQIGLKINFQVKI